MGHSERERVKYSTLIAAKASPALVSISTKVATIQMATAGRKTRN